MENVKQHVHEVLERAFPGATINLEQDSPADKVDGVLIWDGFEEMEQIDRQRLLAKKLREGLPPEVRARVSAILTFTHVETTVPSES